MSGADTRRKITTGSCDARKARKAQARRRDASGGVCAGGATESTKNNQDATSMARPAALVRLRPLAGLAFMAALTACAGKKPPPPPPWEPKTPSGPKRS